MKRLKRTARDAISAKGGPSNQRSQIATTPGTGSATEVTEISRPIEPISHRHTTSSVAYNAGKGFSNRLNATRDALKGILLRSNLSKTENVQDVGQSTLSVAGNESDTQPTPPSGSPESSGPSNNRLQDITLETTPREDIYDIKSEFMQITNHLKEELANIIRQEIRTVVKEELAVVAKGGKLSEAREKIQTPKAYEQKEWPGQQQEDYFSQDVPTEWEDPKEELEREISNIDENLRRMSLSPRKPKGELPMWKFLHSNPSTYWDHLLEMGVRMITEACIRKGPRVTLKGADMTKKIADFYKGLTKKHAAITPDLAEKYSLKLEQWIEEQNKPKLTEKKKNQVEETEGRIKAKGTNKKEAPVGEIEGQNMVDCEEKKKASIAEPKWQAHFFKESEGLFHRIIWPTVEDSNHESGDTDVNALPKAFEKLAIAPQITLPGRLLPRSLVGHSYIPDCLIGFHADDDWDWCTRADVFLRPSNAYKLCMPFLACELKQDGEDEKKKMNAECEIARDMMDICEYYHQLEKKAQHPRKDRIADHHIPAVGITTCGSKVKMWMMQRYYNPEEGRVVYDMHAVWEGNLIEKDAMIQFLRIIRNLLEYIERKYAKYFKLCIKKIKSRRASQAAESSRSPRSPRSPQTSGYSDNLRRSQTYPLTTPTKCGNSQEPLHDIEPPSPESLKRTEPMASRLFQKALDYSTARGDATVKDGQDGIVKEEKDSIKEEENEGTLELEDVFTDNYKTSSKDGSTLKNSVAIGASVEKLSGFREASESHDTTDNFSETNDTAQKDSVFRDRSPSLKLSMATRTDLRPKLGNLGTTETNNDRTYTPFLDLPLKDEYIVPPGCVDPNFLRISRDLHRSRSITFTRDPLSFEPNIKASQPRGRSLSSGNIPQGAKIETLRVNESSHERIDFRVEEAPSGESSSSGSRSGDADMASDKEPSQKDSPCQPWNGSNEDLDDGGTSTGDDREGNDMEPVCGSQDVSYRDALLMQDAMLGQDARDGHLAEAAGIAPAETASGAEGSTFPSTSDQSDNDSNEPSPNPNSKPRIELSEIAKDVRDLNRGFQLADVRDHEFKFEV